MDNCHTVVRGIDHVLQVRRSTVGVKVAVSSGACTREAMVMEWFRDLRFVRGHATLLVLYELAIRPFSNTSTCSTCGNGREKFLQPDIMISSVNRTGTVLVLLSTILHGRRVAFWLGGQFTDILPPSHLGTSGADPL